MVGNRALSALWIVPAAVAVATGILVLAMSLAFSSDTGMGALLGAVWLFIAQAVFVVASLGALLVMLAQVTTPMNSSARLLLWALVVVWLGLRLLLPMLGLG